MWPDRLPEDDSLWSNWVRSRMGDRSISGSKQETRLRRIGYENHLPKLDFPAQIWVRYSFCALRSRYPYSVRVFLMCKLMDSSKNSVPKYAQSLFHDLAKH